MRPDLAVFVEGCLHRDSACLALATAGIPYRIAFASQSRAGVLVRPIGNKIVLSPPLTLTGAEAELIVAALDTALAACG